VRAYVARPANATGPLPGVLMVHESRSLNPHIQDITRRLALDNFIAVAPDALFTVGATPTTKKWRVRCSSRSTSPRRARTS
jgi:carboxymethylenebutenolidase